MNKIKITKISKACLSQKGFDGKGCFGCDCPDACCRYGADFDQESYDLLQANRSWVEQRLLCALEACFNKNWGTDTEYLGHRARRSKIREDGFCVFHHRQGKGCVLYALVMEKNINRRMVPSICRLFPLTWNYGELMVYNEQENCVIPNSCNCAEPENTTTKNILETQQNEIADIFDLFV